MSPARALTLTAILAITTAVSAQDVPPQLSGRLESSYTWLAEGNQSLGVVGGWTGLIAGTRDVKTELRLGFANLPTPSVTLQRAWVKFRFPGLRFTTGLGRLAWGSGFVLVPGDLLFDAVSSEMDFGADELRSAGAWLADAWLALGDEAFVEVGALKDVAGLRVSAAPGGVTLEAAGAWDRSSLTAKAALSTQFHLGVDWYGTVRQDWSPHRGTPSLDDLRGSAGAFGHGSLTDSIQFATRHEVLLGVRPDSLRSYHDASLLFDEGWTITGRVLVDRGANQWSPSAEVGWGPLQNLHLSLVAPLQPPWLVRAAVTAKW